MDLTKGLQVIMQNSFHQAGLSRAEDERRECVPNLFIHFYAYVFTYACSNKIDSKSAFELCVFRLFIKIREILPIF